MPSPLTRALDLTVALDAAATSQAVGLGLVEALAPFGARTVFAASFALPVAGDVTTFHATRRLFAQRSPPGWIDGYFRRGLHDRNPVVFGTARRTTAFRWSDPGFADLMNWPGLDFARELGIADGICVPCHGVGLEAGLVSFGFERIDLSPTERQAFVLAASLGYDRMRTLAAPRAPKRPVLTPRERDCLAYVAEGLSDAAIASKLGIAPVTAHAHVENAKRKLGARSRAQAVARFYALGLF